MFHWYLFYFFCALLVGMASLTINAVAYARSKTDWMPYYLYFYTVFTVLIGVDLATYYLITNLLPVYLAHSMAISYPGTFVFTPLLTLSLPLFVHALGGLPDRLHFFRRMAIVVGSEIILQHIMLFTLDNWELYEVVGDVVILGMIIYTFVLGKRAYQAAQEPDRKRLVSRFLLLLGFTLFCQIFDTAMSLFFPFFLLYPLAYASMGVIFAHASLHTILQSDSLPVPDVEKLRAIPETLVGSQTPLPVTHAAEEAEFSSNGLSEREQEILLFVLKGCSNADIAELANISLSTVKAHLTNIYEKVGVKNRYELISYFSNPQFPLPKTEGNPLNNGDSDASTKGY